MSLFIRPDLYVGLSVSGLRFEVQCRSHDATGRVSPRFEVHFLTRSATSSAFLFFGGEMHSEVPLHFREMHSEELEVYFLKRPVQCIFLGGGGEIHSEVPFRFREMHSE